MKSNRILTIVLAVTITPFAAVAQARTASKDGATTPKAPVLASVGGNGDAAELNDILAVPTAVPLGPADILDQYEQAMAATAQGFNVEVSRIADAVQQKAITEQQGESLCKEAYERALMQFQALSSLHDMLEEQVTEAAAPAPQANQAPAAGTNGSSYRNTLHAVAAGSKSI